MESQVLTLGFVDPDQVDLDTLDDADLVVTREGFAQVRLPVRLIPDSLPEREDATDFTAQYAVAPPDHPFEIPNGTWHPIDNGTYS